jgi:carbamoyltransferase
MLYCAIIRLKIFDIMNILSLIASHDASVAYISDGKLKYFAKEERLSGYKHDKGFTKCLDYIIKNDFKVDLVVLNSVFSSDNFNDFLETILKKQFNCNVINLRYEHHLSHACLAFYNSGYDNALVFVADRNGSKDEYCAEVESIFKIDKNYNIASVYKNLAAAQIGKVDFDEEIVNRVRQYKIKNPTCDVRCDSTLGVTQVYESATTLIGECVLNNGKVMGLSSYGKDADFKSLFHDGIANSHLFMKCMVDGHDKVLLKEHYGKAIREVNETSYQFYADYSFQVQKQTQEEVLRIIKHYVEKTNIKKVCVTGGYGLNVVTNQYLIKNLPEVDFYFEPISDDTGISLGAAIYAHKNEVGTVPHIPKHTFFHHVNYDLKDIKGKRVSEQDIANFIIDQKTVAVFNGQAEVGPRALGNRSILFDVRNPKAKDIVNRIKRREWYRPFACSVLKEDAKEYFEMYHLDESPNMTISFPVKTDSIPGVTHVDNTCRIQTVDSSIPHFYNLIKEFKKITGTSVILNTSFNLAGEPLVESLDDAIDVFNRSEIDVLWFPEKRIAIIKKDMQ